jgi:hypothetical protein
MDLIMLKTLAGVYRPGKRQENECQRIGINLSRLPEVRVKDEFGKGRHDVLSN